MSEKDTAIRRERETQTLRNTKTPAHAEYPLRGSFLGMQARKGLAATVDPGHPEKRKAHAEKEYRDLNRTGN